MKRNGGSHRQHHADQTHTLPRLFGDIPATNISPLCPLPPTSGISPGSQILSYPTPTPSPSYGKQEVKDVLKQEKSQKGLSHRALRSSISHSYLSSVSESRAQVCLANSSSMGTVSTFGKKAEERGSWKVEEQEDFIPNFSLQAIFKCSILCFSFHLSLPLT